MLSSLFSSATHFILNQKNLKRHYLFELQNAWLAKNLSRPYRIRIWKWTFVRKLELKFQFTINFNALCLAMPVDIWDTGESVANAAWWIKKDGSQSLPPGLSKCYRKQTQFPTLWGAYCQANEQTQMNEQGGMTLTHCAKSRSIIVSNSLYVVLIMK